MTKISDLRFEWLEHPPRFSSNEEAITFVNNYFTEKIAEYYLDGLTSRERRREMCVELQGDYGEKNCNAVLEDTFSSPGVTRWNLYYDSINQSLLKKGKKLELVVFKTAT